MAEKQIGLFDKLLFLHLLSTTILFLIIVVSYYHIEKNNFNNNLMKKSILLRDVLEISSVDPIVSTIAYDRIDQAIETLYNKNPEIVYIEIYDPNAHIIALVGQVPEVNISTERINRLFKKDFTSKNQANINQNYNELITFLNVGDRHLGLIRLGFTKKYLQDQLRRNIQYFLGFFIIAIAVTSLLFYMFTNKWIVLPIINVSKIMKRYGQDELYTLLNNIKKYNKSIRKDEIGTMSSAFEWMVSSIIKRTKEKEKAEERYRLIAENVADVIWTMDMDLHYTFISPSIYQLRGYTFEEAMEQSIEEVLLPDSLEAVMNLFVKILTRIESGDEEGLKAVEFEAKQICKDDTVIWTSNNARILLGPDGQPASILGVTHDITHRKQAEELMIKSEKQFRDLFNSITDLIYTQDMEGRFIAANPAMHKLFGYDMDEFLGHPAADFMEPSLRSDFTSRYLKVIKQQGYKEGRECYYTKNGKKIYLDYKSSLVEQNSGECYITGMARDVTEKILSENQVKILQEQVVQSQKMEAIGTLAGGIAHDFNNILFPIMGHTEMLIKDVDENSPMQKALVKIYNGAIRARDLVKQILTFSRQESNELKTIKIQPIIKEVLKLIRATIPTTIEIKSDIQPDCSTINADPTQIHQIVMNLATNAYHAMEETGGVLNIRLKEVELSKSDLINSDITSGTFACLIISDAGKGMDKELIQKIFDPFFTTKELGKGTGMGLSVVHGIVASMKGDIQVFSEPGKGTQFNVYIPIIKNMKEQKIPNAKEPIQRGTEHILLVDDEEDIIEMEKKMLELMGYQVTSYTSSIEALEVFHNNSDDFDIIITDMAMPNMSGDVLSTELIKIRPDIPILLCSGFSEFMSEEKAISIGIKGFLMKPIVMKDLSQKMYEVLERN